MDPVYLKPVTDDIRQQCIELRPRDNQLKFVASNLNSLQKAAEEKTCHPYAIYAGDFMVGFALFDEEPYPEDGCFWIVRFMIDRNYQGRGYGKAGLSAVLRKQKEHPACTVIRISHVPDNTAANRLYKGLGFKETGQFINGELVLDLEV